jgi:hypothetical protein
MLTGHSASLRFLFAKNRVNERYRDFSTTMKPPTPPELTLLAYGGHRTSDVNR